MEKIFVALVTIVLCAVFPAKDQDKNMNCGEKEMVSTQETERN